MKPITSFREGQRVRVRACMIDTNHLAASLDLEGSPLGTVRRRLTKGDSAWIELDQRIARKREQPDPHPFPDAGSYRAKYVLARPFQCLETDEPPLAAKWGPSGTPLDDLPRATLAGETVPKK
jgi:hypothetical protein